MVPTNAVSRMPSCPCPGRAARGCMAAAARVPPSVPVPTVSLRSGLAMTGDEPAADADPGRVLADAQSQLKSSRTTPNAAPMPSGYSRTWLIAFVGVKVAPSAAPVHSRAGELGAANGTTSSVRLTPACTRLSPQKG